MYLNFEIGVLYEILFHHKHFILAYQCSLTKCLYYGIAIKRLVRVIILFT